MQNWFWPIQDLFNDILEDANALMAEVGVRKENKILEKPVPVSEPEQPRMTLHCDVNGCTIAPVLDDAAAFTGQLGGYNRGDGPHLLRLMPTVSKH